MKRPDGLVSFSFGLFFFFSFGHPAPLLDFCFLNRLAFRTMTTLSAPIRPVTPSVLPSLFTSLCPCPSRKVFSLSQLRGRTFSFLRAGVCL